MQGIVPANKLVQIAPARLIAFQITAVIARWQFVVCSSNGVLVSKIGVLNIAEERGVVVWGFALPELPDRLAIMVQVFPTNVNQAFVHLQMFVQINQTGVGA